MKEIIVGRHTILVDDEDYDDVIKYYWAVAKVSQRHQTFYAYRTKWLGGKQRRIYMHTHITGYSRTDHKDHNGLNNQRSNLREATRSQNQGNSLKPRKDSTSQYKGVYWNSRRAKWVAVIVKDGRSYHLGSFDSEIEAAQAYNDGALHHQGEFALVNQLDEGELAAARARRKVWRKQLASLLGIGEKGYVAAMENGLFLAPYYTRSGRPWWWEDELLEWWDDKGEEQVTLFLRTLKKPSHIKKLDVWKPRLNRYKYLQAQEYLGLSMPAFVKLIKSGCLPHDGMLQGPKRVRYWNEDTLATYLLSKED